MHTPLALLFLFFIFYNLMNLALLIQEEKHTGRQTKELQLCECWIEKANVYIQVPFVQQKINQILNPSLAYSSFSLVPANNYYMQWVTATGLSLLLCLLAAVINTIDYTEWVTKNLFTTSPFQVKDWIAEDTWRRQTKTQIYSSNHVAFNLFDLFRSLFVNLSFAINQKQQLSFYRSIRISLSFCIDWSSVAYCMRLSV